MAKALGNYCNTPHDKSWGYLIRMWIMEWFGGITAFTEFHNNMTDEQAITGLIDEDDY